MTPPTLSDPILRAPVHQHAVFAQTTRARRNDR